METDGGGWTLVMLQLANECLADSTETVGEMDGGLDHSYRLGSAELAMIRPSVAWVLSDESVKRPADPNRLRHFMNGATFHARLFQCFRSARTEFAGLFRTGSSSVQAASSTLNRLLLVFFYNFFNAPPSFLHKLHRFVAEQERQHYLLGIHD